MNDKQHIIMTRMANVLIKQYGFSLSPVQATSAEFAIYQRLKADKNEIVIFSLAQQVTDLEVIVSGLVRFDWGKNIQLSPPQIMVVLFNVNDFAYPDIDSYVVQDTIDERLMQRFPQLKTVSFEIGDVQRDLFLERQYQTEFLKKNIWRNQLKAQLKLQPLTIALLAICIGVFLLGYYVQQFQTYETSWLVALGAMYTPFIQGAGQYWRLLAAGFIHVSWLHLLVNLVALINLMSITYKRYSNKQIGLTILLSVIVGNSFSYLGNDMLSAGLSGGLYGLLGLLIVYFVESKLIKLPQVRSNLITILMINLWINFMPNVSWLAHLGGFAAGLLTGLAYSKQKSLSLNALIATLLGVVLMGYAVVNRPLSKEQYLLTDQDVISIYEQLGLKSLADSTHHQMQDYYQISLEE